MNEGASANPSLSSSVSSTASGGTWKLVSSSSTFHKLLLLSPWWWYMAPTEGAGTTILASPQTLVGVCPWKERLGSVLHCCRGEEGTAWRELCSSNLCCFLLSWARWSNTSGRSSFFLLPWLAALLPGVALSPLRALFLSCVGLGRSLNEQGSSSHTSQPGSLLPSRSRLPVGSKCRESLRPPPPPPPPKAILLAGGK